jgi:hypothetical protein
MTRKPLLLLASAILVVSCSNSNKSESSSGSPTSTSGAQQNTGSVLRLDAALDQIVPKDAVIQELAGGFQFTEGPLWRPQARVLWFSDVVGNVVRQWSPNGEVKVLIQKAGGDSGNLPPGGFVGPNGAVADKDGFVLICQHTARRIVRMGKDLQPTRLVERYGGSTSTVRMISFIGLTGHSISLILPTDWRGRMKTRPKRFRLMASTA